MYTENKTKVQIWKTKGKSYIITFMITSTKKTKESYTVLFWYFASRDINLQVIFIKFTQVALKKDKHLKLVFPIIQL